MYNLPLIEQILSISGAKSEKVKVNESKYSKDSIIRPGLIIFKLFKNGLSTVLIIESFDIFWNSTYNRDSTYNFL